MVLARKFLAALGKLAVGMRGALGISSETTAESGKARRTATNAPPAETFRAVANSSISLPASSEVRTKTGIANGRRGHFRRSSTGFWRASIGTIRRYRGLLPHLWGQIVGGVWGVYGGNAGGLRVSHRNEPIAKDLSLPEFLHLFAGGEIRWAANKYFRLQTFAHEW
jgi:hypothetical protein